MLHDWCRERPRPLLPFGPKWVAPLIDAPAVVATALDEIDHLPQVLPHFAGPEPFLPVEAKLPHLPMAKRPDLASGAGSRDEWIVLGNRVGAVPLGMIHVDAKDRTEHVAEVLTGREFIRDPAAVPGREIEIALGTESNAAAVVAPRGPFQDDLLGLRVRHRGIGLVRLESREAAPFRLRLRGVENVRHVEIAVLREARMEDDPVGCLADVDQEIRLRDVRAILERVDLARSRRHAEPPRARNHA